MNYDMKRQEQWITPTVFEGTPALTNLSLQRFFGDESIRGILRFVLPQQFYKFRCEYKGNPGEAEVRSKQLIGALNYFGVETIEPHPMMEEVDCILVDTGTPLSIKTEDKDAPSTVKVKWTSNDDKMQEFVDAYSPSCDMLYCHYNRRGKTIRLRSGQRVKDYWGRLYYIPLIVQQDVFANVGRALYFNDLPFGTNGRGVAIRPSVFTDMLTDKRNKYIPINWEYWKHSDECKNYDSMRKYIEPFEIYEERSENKQKEKNSHIVIRQCGQSKS